MNIFLGYPSEHEAIAWEVYGFLKERGDDVWFDKVSLVAGTDWDRERTKGQSEAQLVIHLCSEAILKRAGVVNREIRETLRLVEDQPLGSLYVIPIRLEPIKMPLEFTRFQYFDFDERWKQRLGEGVEKRRAQLAGQLLEPPKGQIAAVAPPAEVQKIEFDDVTEAYECRGEYLQYGERGLYWTFVNGAIAAKSLKGFFAARSDFVSMLAEDDDPPDWRKEMKHEWSINAEEVYRHHDMISIRFYTYIGFAGAAHPNHYITTLNFFGEIHGELKIEQLLGHNPERARRILTYCEDVLMAEFKDEIGKEDFFGGYKEHDSDVWKIISQYNFDSRGITINISPYDVLPYVFGSHEIHVPWRIVEPLMADGLAGIIKQATGQV